MFLSWDSDPNHKEEFLDLLETGSFVKWVKHLRKKIDIQEGGFRVKPNYLNETTKGKHFNDKDRKIVKLEIDKLVKRKNISTQLSEVIEHYVWKGEDYRKGLVPLSTPIFGCYIGEANDEGDIPIWIMSGAIKKDIVNFVNKFGDDAIKELRLNSPEAYKRKRKNKKYTREKSTKVFALYEEKVFKSDGNLDIVGAKRYLAENNISLENLNSRELLRISGIPMLGQEAIKKIITRYKKFRKS